MDRRPRRLLKTWPLWLFVVTGTISESAAGYQEVGHYYTLTAILSDANDADATPLDYNRLIAFCAELPDLSRDLDALTQRVLVLGSHEELEWGIAGKCDTRLSQHMVMTQYYLHALTGTHLAGKSSQNDVRNAARALIIKLRQRFSEEPSGQGKVNLACEIGFAAHLLGDSYAHTRLDDGHTYYPTGLGHARDLSTPDYVLTRSGETNPTVRSNSWGEWANDASRVFVGVDLNADIAKLAVDLSAKSRDRDDRAMETTVMNQLRAIGDAKSGGMFLPITTSGEKSWNKPLDGSIWQVLFPTLPYTCQAQVDRGPAGEGNGIPPIEGTRPVCDEVWINYLREAKVEFRAHEVDVPNNSAIDSSCNSESDRLADGNPK